MKILTSLTITGVLLLSIAISSAQEAPATPDALVTRLLTADVDAITAVCAKLIDPARRTETDDTLERTALHGLALRSSQTPELRSRVETAFLAGLASPATPMVKAFLLSELRYMADDACLSALPPFLLDPDLSDRAVRICVTLRSDAAAKTLCEALPAAEGTARLNILQGLGELGNDSAMEALRKAAGSDDRDLRMVALEALARAGDAGDLELLHRATAAASRYERARLESAYLQLLAGMVQTGQREAAERAALEFARECPAEPHITCAALDLCSGSDTAPAADFAIACLGAESARVRRCAGETLAAMPGARIVPILLDRLNAADKAVKLGAVAVLARRREAAAMPGIRTLTRGDDPEICGAAVEALGTIEGSGAIPELVTLLGGSPELDRRITNALVALDDPNADAVIGAALAAAADPAKPGLLDALVRRVAVAQVPVVREQLGSPNPDIVKEAVRALGVLGGQDQLDLLLNLLLTATDRQMGERAGDAIMDICRRMPDRNELVPAILDAYKKGTPAARIALLRILPVIGSGEALKGTESALADPDTGVRNAGVRTLADWKSAEAVPLLEKIVTDAEEPVHRVLAFRGYVRLLSEDSRYAGDRLAKLDHAMEICPRDEEKKLVLAAYGKSRNGEALKRLRSYLDGPFFNEAAAGIMELSRAVRDGSAVSALTAAMAKTSDDRTRQRLRDTLKEISKDVGWIQSWQVAGPYTDSGKGITELHNVVFPPEQPGAPDVVWKEASADSKHMLDLAAVIGGNSRAAYARTNLSVPADVEVIMEVGSDDGLKVWLNGNVVHEKNVPRAYTAGEDRVPLELLAGENTLLLKVTQGGGGWAAGARITGADGLAVPDLSIHFGEAVSRPMVPRKLVDGAPYAEQLGWRASVQFWSFNKRTFVESVDLARRMGLKVVEMFPGQSLDAEHSDWKTDQGMNDEAKAIVRATLTEAGIAVANFGVTGIPADEAAARKLFTWAKEMGIETICAEPPPEQLPAIDALCQEYGINVALHNHPEPSRYWNPQTVLDKCKGLSPRIGACADTGHWMRSGVNPIDAVKLLEGRIITFHFKDLNTYGKEGAHDVPWGTGQADIPAILRLLLKQGFRGVFSSEYEYNWGHNEGDIAACVRNFDAMAREIMLEDNGQWQVLFSMRNLDNWMGSNGDVPAAGWQIVEENLVRAGGGGYIWTRERFGDFILELDFNTEGNSGLFFRTDNPKDPVQTGLEMQVEKEQTSGIHGVGAIYDMMAPSAQAGKPGWNHVVLTARGSRITVELNGQQIIDINLDDWKTPEMNPDGSKNKFKRAIREYKQEGHIGFQDHGARVMYRNIRIRRLAAATPAE